MEVSVSIINIFSDGLYVIYFMGTISSSHFGTIAIVRDVKEIWSLAYGANNSFDYSARILLKTGQQLYIRSTVLPTRCQLDVSLAFRKIV